MPYVALLTLAMACGTPERLPSPEGVRFIDDASYVAMGVLDDESDPAIGQGWIALFEGGEQPRWQTLLELEGLQRLRDAAVMRDREIVAVGSSGEAAYVVLLEPDVGGRIWEKEIVIPGSTVAAHSVHVTATDNDIIVAGRVSDPALSDPASGMFVVRFRRDGSVRFQRHIQSDTGLVPERILVRPAGGWYLAGYESGLEVGSSFVAAFAESGMIDWAKALPVPEPARLTHFIPVSPDSVVAAGVGPTPEGDSDAWAVGLSALGVKEWQFSFEAPLGNEEAVHIASRTDGMFQLVAATDGYGVNPGEGTDLLVIDFSMAGVTRSLAWGSFQDDVPLEMTSSTLVGHIDRNIVRWTLDSAMPDGCGRQSPADVQPLTVPDPVVDVTWTDAELVAEVRDVTATLTHRSTVPTFICQD
jgi:hypothetical protein